MSSLTDDLSWYVSGKSRALLGDTADMFLRFACSPRRYSRVLAGPNKPLRLLNRMRMKNITLSSRAADRAYFTVEGSEYTEAAKFAAQGGPCAGITSRVLRSSSHAAHVSNSQTTTGASIPAESPSATPSVEVAIEAEPARPRRMSIAPKRIEAFCEMETARWKTHATLCARNCKDSCAACKARTRHSPRDSAQACCSVLLTRLMLFANNRQYVHTFKSASDSLRRHADCSPAQARAKERIFNALHLHEHVARSRAAKLQATLSKMMNSDSSILDSRLSQLDTVSRALGLSADSDSDAGVDTAEITPVAVASLAEPPVQARAVVLTAGPSTTALPTPPSAEQLLTDSTANSDMKAMPERRAAPLPPPTQANSAGNQAGAPNIEGEAGEAQVAVPASIPAAADQNTRAGSLSMAELREHDTTTGEEYSE